MLTRNAYGVQWQYKEDLAIAANINLDLGAFGSGSSSARAYAFNYLSMNVVTDDAVEIDIFTGMTSATFAIMATLICAVGLTNNSLYDLPPPFNVGGRLTVAGNLVRIKVRNPTGNIVTPFSIIANMWRE